MQRNAQNISNRTQDQQQQICDKAWKLDKFYLGVGFCFCLRSKQAYEPEKVGGN